jgi:short-subunit dehydrogenase
VRIGPETRAIVTGASAGLGRALAVALATRGARVGVVARRRELLEALIGELAPGPAGQHLALPADISKRRQIERAVERFCKRTGGVDLLFANAGIAHYGPFADVELELAEEMVGVNVLGTTYSVAAALGPMLDQAAGHIVVTSSGAGLRAFPWAAVYGGTKAFDRGFAEALRQELSGTGVSVTTVFLGEVATDLHAHEPQAEPDWRRENEAVPAKRAAERMLAAVEADERNVYVPGLVRLLGLNGVSPKLTDRLLSRIRGPSAAPRRD